MLQVKVIGAESVAKDIKLFRLAATDGAALPDYAPGAHIDLALPEGRSRSYSLVRTCTPGAPYTIAVQHDRNGRGGSRYIYETLGVGDEVAISEPRNSFALDERPSRSILIAGGIGITPLRCMVDRLQALGRDWRLLYAARSRGHAAFADELSDPAMAGRVSFHFDDMAGAPPDLASLIAAAPDGAHFYCCGPAPMLAAYRMATARLPDEVVHLEHFSSDVPVLKSGGFTVTLAKTGLSLEIGEGQSILDALLDAGIEVDYSCEEGHCGACEARVLSGIPDHRDVVLSDRQKSENDRMMICCSGALSSEIVLDL